MVVTVEISGVLEDVLDALVAAGLYQTKSEAVRDAVRRLVESIDLRDVAYRLYVGGGISMQYAMQVAGVGLREFAAYLVSRGAAPELGSVDSDEVAAGADAIADAGAVVVDFTALEASLLAGLAEVAAYTGRPEVYAPSSLSGYARLVPFRSALVAGRAVGAGWLAVERASVQGAAARKLGVTLQELEAIAIAARRGAVYVSCDARSRGLARLEGVRAAPLLSLLVYYLREGLVDRGWARVALERLVSLPAAVGGAEGLV